MNHQVLGDFIRNSREGMGLGELIVEAAYL